MESRLELERKQAAILHDLGGFGPFQASIVMVNTLFLATTLSFLNTLNYGEKAPKEYFSEYKIDDDDITGTVWRSCKAEDFCGDPNLLSYEPDTTHKDFYYNLITKLKLDCAPGSQIGLIGSSFFAGWMITLLFIPRISDLYGRQRLLQIGAALQTLTYFLLTCTESFGVLIGAVTLLGMISTIRVQLVYRYCYELVPKTTWGAVVPVVLFGSTFCSLLIILYLSLYSNDWNSLLYVFIATSVIVLIGSIFFPESPQFLI